MTATFPASDDASLAGVVLAGGKSTRLGQDKADIVFSGITLLDRAVKLLKGHCSTVCVVGRSSPLDCTGSERGAGHGGVSWVMDMVTGHGPAGGVATALKVLHRPCLVLSCDLPLMDGSTLQRLIKARNERPQGALMTAFMQVETGYIEALVAIYEMEALPLLEAALEKGQFQLNRIVPEARRHHLPYSRDEAVPFFNVNHPAELSLLRTMEFSRMGNMASISDASEV